MFGYVNANWKELTQAQQERYGAVYCGICRSIHHRVSNPARAVLSYDMAFLALLHMSLYEPEENAGKNRCVLHVLRPRAWVDNPCVDYAADMNVALAYYKAQDDLQDEGKTSAKLLLSMLEPHMEAIRQRWPRQCDAMKACMEELRELEGANTANPDLPASCFGRLMAELMVYQEDQWQEELRNLGFALGRFIYLADAMLDYDRDKRKKQYNPFLAMGQGRDTGKWEQYLVLAMARCTESYEKLPLVQDKPLLDNILYSGVWVQYRAKVKKEETNG
ncbi:MAG: DUF5685 family protein [Firmicutes bacterium]|nr:DUF5685 family protein [Bacillota bacterium]MDY6161685.1 DUF5685 family protein [Candidatus Faecousia sp.]